MARCLIFKVPYCTTLFHLNCVALDILQLDRVDWMYINTLIVAGSFLDCWHYLKPVDVDESLAADIVRILQYFGRNVRNIAELDMTEPYLGAMGDLICDVFASMYGGQLQILRARVPVPLPFSHFSRQLSVLELTLDSSAARVLPSVCGETLRVLKLDKVPHNFAWHHFRYDIFVRPIVFRRLVIFHIAYKNNFGLSPDDEVRSRVISGAHNCDQLCFPVLKRLIISNCTPDCDLLYADTPFPKLEMVRISGTFDEIRHCTRLKLIWVGDLRVEINSSWDDLAADIYNVTNHFFSNIGISRSAALDCEVRQFSIDPELIRWVNLTDLQMRAVSYETLCKLIARLPNLTEFQTIGLDFGTITADTFSVDESLFRSTDPLLAWGAKLTNLIIADFSDYYPMEASAIAVQAFAQHAGALKKFTVPRSVKSSIAGFIDEYKNRYPHLTDIVLSVY
ncbi:hypothetical protein GGF42_002827 [Coemansia sp. RSA 2424]|nr:hypothetical protein GGF42_002827 [Coemansia sp. RSA 2424]